MPDFRNGHFAIVSYSLARLGHTPDALWLSTFLELSLPQLRSFSPQNLANTAWALGSFRTPLFGRASGGGRAGAGATAAAAAWLPAFLEASRDALPELGSAGLGQIAHGLARLGQRPPDAWVSAALARLVPLAPVAEVLHDANVLWALGTWGYRPDGPTMGALMQARPAAASRSPPPPPQLMLCCPLVQRRSACRSTTL
jgi:hypothetical protein